MDGRGVLLALALVATTYLLGRYALGPISRRMGRAEAYLLPMALAVVAVGVLVLLTPQNPNVTLRDAAAVAAIFLGVMGVPADVGVYVARRGH